MKKILILILALLLLTVASGCGNRTEKSASGDGTLRIVTSFYPMYIDTINVTKGVDGVTVTNMTKPQTGCLHDYQLTTEDMKILERADIFVVNGAGMESFLDNVIKNRHSLIVVDASKNIPLMEEDGEPNPHVWLSVPASIAQVKNITKQLQDADPAHAEQYQANCDAYVAKLEELNSEMHAKLDNVAHRDIVTFHEAFPYFARDFNLNIVSVIEREPGSDPSPADLEITIRQIRELPHTALFAEPQYSPAAAETISRETGMPLYSLDPVVTGESVPEAADEYLTRMRQNAEILYEALN